MNIARAMCLPVMTLGCLAAAVGQGSAELVYLGRASVKIRTASGFVVYIDPYAPGDYSEPADLVLVTHGHGDHNQVRLASRKPSAVIAAPKGAVSDGGARAVAEGDSFSVGPVSVRVMPAANKNHARSESVGYILSFDGVVVYHAGDTDYLPDMEGWAKYRISWALLPCDGYYNMGPAEAARCALAMGARRVIPIHSSKDRLFDAKNAGAVGAPGTLVLAPGSKTPLAP